jgi:hypothetical protein
VSAVAGVDNHRCREDSFIGNIPTCLASQPFNLLSSSGTSPSSFLEHMGSEEATG